MARFYDKVGYAVRVNPVKGVWTDDIVERYYKGEVKSLTKYREEGEQVNDNVRLNKRIEILADAFAFENFFNIKYVSWAGTLWIVQSVDVSRPRLILTLGGVYNGPRPTP